MDQLKQFGTQLDNMITMSQNLLALSDEAEPDLQRLEMGFQNRGKLLDEIQSGAQSINWKSEIPTKEREQILTSFENLKEIDSKLRGRMAFLLSQKKQVLQEAQRNEKADKRYQKKQRVDNAMFIRNKLEG